MRADFIPQGAHDLRAAVIAGGVHPFAAGAAAVDGAHRAIGVFIEHRAQRFEPGDHTGRVHHQGFDQLGMVGERPAAHHIQVVDGRRVVFFIGGLDAALGHHRIGVAEAQLGGQQDIRPVGLGEQSRAGARPTPANHQHIAGRIRLLGKDRIVFQ